MTHIKLFSMLAFMGILAFVFSLVQSPLNVEGASVGGGYTYKHYTSADASSTVRTIVYGGAGELGTVTVNTTGATPIRLYDAATTTQATTTLTAIAVLKPSVAEQTFTYDVSLNKGLLIEIPATYAGDITIGVR